MRQTSSHWQRNTDLYSTFLGSFFIVLIVLFAYLFKTDKQITQYDLSHHRLDKMRILNYRLDNFFHQTYRYIDYDKTSKLRHRLDVLVASLKTEEIKESFGNHIYREIQTIQTEYAKKAHYFEDFKMLNATVTNSLHFLYDLRRTLEEKLINEPKQKILVDDIFFSISQIVMDMPYDKQRVFARLRSLKEHGGDDREISYFIQHSKEFLRNVEKMRALKRSVEQIPLSRSLDQILEEMSMQYEHKRYSQRMITLLLILFAFALMGILIYSYRRIRKNTLELQAFRYAIEKSDNAIMLTNPQREIEYVNEAFELRTGYTKEEVIGKDPNILKSDLHPSIFYREMNDILDRGETWQGELINRRKDGSLLYEKASIIPVYIDGELVQYLAIKLDITDYKEQQQRLKQAAAVYDLMGDGILITDAQKRIVAVNPAFVKMFGYSEEELIGQEPMVIRSLEEDTYFYKQMWDQLLSRDRWSGKLYNETKDGTALPIWLTLTVVRDERGEIKNYIGIYTNLQEIIATQERAEYLAYHDSLTGLPNRAYFDMRIADILDVAKKENERVAVLFLDLDRFKVINDTLGHTVGDEMLVELSKRMRALFDNDVLFARMGGDEFVVTFIVKEDHTDKIKAVAEKILSVIREPIHVYDYHLNMTASIGIAIFPDDGKDKYEIVKYADSAMYAAKEKGKDTFQFYSQALSKAVEKRLILEQELKYALERDELSLYYQPQYRFDDHTVVGVEVLLRWHNRQLGSISPEAFMPIAEETGLIVKMGYFVIEEACRTFVKWKNAGYGIETIAINISVVQFRDEAFMQNVKEIFKETGIDSTAVEIEITERVIMEYSSTNMTILEDLRVLGCKISIDDFGTGYSSMSYMKRLPIDAIKIDKSFIDDLPGNIHDTEVTKAIIALSKSLGYQVIAEGIENEAQESFLKTAGCDLGQGYFFAKPMDEERFIRFLDEKHTNFTV